jgi:Arc/MetJ-type ribon-helix-helix transcriptional regulator
MERTQIYLDESQKAALRAIAADRGQNVSDVIRQAIDRLLSEDLDTVDIAARLDAVKARIAARVGSVSDEQIDDAAKLAKQQIRSRRHVAA